VDALSLMVIGTGPGRAVQICDRLKDEIPGRCSRSHPGAIGGPSSPVRPSPPFGKMSPPNVMAGISPGAQTPGEAEKRKTADEMVGSVEIPQGAFVAVLKSDTIDSQIPDKE